MVVDLGPIGEQVVGAMALVPWGIAFNPWWEIIGSSGGNKDKGIIFWEFKGKASHDDCGSGVPGVSLVLC